MSRVRAAARLGHVALILIACLPPHLAARARRRPSPWPQRFLHRAARAMGVALTVRGRPLPGHVLLVANHRSWLDILVIAAASGCAFVAKAEIRRWPVVGWLAALHHTVFVERSQRGAARDQAETLRAALAGGAAIALFPEGATHEGVGLLPFKPSLFAAVAPAPPGVRVQPVLIDYGRDTAHVSWPDAESAPANILRVIGRRGTIAATVTFLDPLDPTGFADRKGIAVAARAALETAGGFR